MNASPRDERPRRRRLPVGLILALVLAVVVAAGIVIFVLASGTGAPATGSTTGVVVAPGVLVPG